ncbi:DUF6624 domain-containing protein [Mucilaginibacter sabulilitoris]|uniref:DUF6624 domain-containing protein n=1 Tax=Mucilaginibacter sabulilitoris TaxID=1173583 RepID=A0ABZ0TJM3_9SPHI|nr:DUF6624 domain-containing protein [Mucilaginibacter sabulilitoris]WPU93009.1 DUF6624 domain-containing protein [Mucilaginibacter sabulilitoris]
MKSILIKIAFLIALMSGYFIVAPLAQTGKKNTALINQIDTMFKYDQFWRKEYLKVQRKEKSVYSDETIQRKWSETDRANEIKAKKIIRKFGYPGYNLIGETSNDFWAIIQHCDDDVPFQEHVLSLMKKEIDKSNASKRNYAYLADRILINKNQKQIYGTQLSRNDKTGKFLPFPLKYPQSVDKLRKQMDLEPLADYVKNFE